MKEKETHILDPSYDGFFIQSFRKEFIMKENMLSPYLYFNFLDHTNKKKPIQFYQPVDVITTNNKNEIMDCLKQVEETIQKGYYLAGYLSYEAGAAFHDEIIIRDNKLPLIWFGVFENAIYKETKNIQHYTIPTWKPQVEKQQYKKMIEEILQYIKQGKIEQVNYTIPFHTKLYGDTFSFYKQLEQAQNANYTAFLNIGDYSIVSASPELFFQLKNGKITVKPMKGTVERGKTYKEDIENKQWLKSSLKNQTENKLTVELMMKDLQSITKNNSITLEKEFQVEKYPTVYQMTSTLTATLSSDKSFIDIWKALFPSGSITGLPKKEAMKLITSLEKKPREVYCGAIGYITPNREAVFNVPIRTAYINNNNGEAIYGAGGGITENSLKEDEYKEVIAKTKVLYSKQPEFQLLESLGLYNGKYLVLDSHLNRLEQSAKYFEFQINMDEINETLQHIAKKYKKQNWKVRLLVNRNGKITVEVEKINTLPKELLVSIADEPVNKDDVFLYHKTTNRIMYETRKKNNVFDTLLWNQDKEITEFTIGNFVLEKNQTYITPPVESGLLAGTFRDKLLKEGKLKEECIFIDDITKSSSIWLINSVRGWVKVNLK